MANTSSRSGMPHDGPRNTIENDTAFIEDVRSRAYELYESRGRWDGYDLDDWFLAEQQALRHAAWGKGPWLTGSDY